MTLLSRLLWLKLLLYLVLTLYAVITLIPFLWALSASFKPLSEIISGNLIFSLRILPLIITNRYLYKNRYFGVGFSTVCS